MNPRQKLIELAALHRAGRYPTVILSFLIGAVGTLAFAADQNVTNTDDSGPGSLRRAVADVGAAENVIFQPAVAGGTINLNAGVLDVTRSMNFVNNSGGVVTISGSDQCYTNITGVGATTSFDSGLAFQSSTTVDNGNVGALLVQHSHTINGLHSTLRASSLSGQGGNSYGLLAFDDLNITGGGLTAPISASSVLNAATGSAGSYGLVFAGANSTITGGINSVIATETSGSSTGGDFHSVGISSYGDLTINGGLQGSISASLRNDTATSGTNTCRGLDVLNTLEVNDGLSADITAISYDGNVEGIYARNLAVNGGISGRILAYSQTLKGSATGIQLGDFSFGHIDEISGLVDCLGNHAVGIFAGGSLNGGNQDIPLVISGCVTVSASNQADAIAYVGPLNIKVESTGAIYAVSSHETPYAIRGFSQVAEDDVVELVAGCSILGSIFLGDATDHDTLTLSGDNQGVSTINGDIWSFGSGHLDIGVTGGNWYINGAISRAASLNVSGGSITLLGQNTYTRGTTVDNGVLIVNGQIVGDLYINGGGIVGGIGQVGNVFNNGTLAPGNSIGTMTVAGNYTQNPGSTLEIEINDAGASDRLNITGDATINGGKVLVVTEPGTYTAGMTYRILEADSVTGSFDEVTDILPFLKGELHYGMDYIDLLLVHSPYAAVAQTRNQFSTATYLDDLYDSASGDLATVMGALDALSASEARAAFDHLSGEPYADLAAVNMNAANLFTDTAFYRLYNGADLNCANPPGRQFWAYGLGNWERQRATGAGWDSSFGYANQLAGFMVGCDQQFGNILLGFGGGYGQSNVGYIGNPASDQTDLFNFSLYGKADFGAAYLAGVVGYTHGWNDMTRIIAIEGLNPRQATASVDGNVFGTLVQAGYNIEHGWWRITPIIGLRYGHGGMSDATETGADSVNLAVGSTWRNSLVGHLGGRLAFCVKRKWRAEAYGQWEHEYSDTASDVTMAFAGSPGEFTVHSAVVERDAARTGVVAIGQLNERVSVHLNYDALLRASYASQQLTGGLSIGF